MKELEKSKEKQKNLENELNETKKNFNVAKEYNNKMQELTKEASQMIKSSIDSREKMKEEYDKAIKELVAKYEKQIQIMKVIIVEQNEKYEKQLEQIKKEEDKKDKNENTNENKETEKKINEKNDIEEEQRNKYLEKLKKDNTMLLNQNSELKHMNEMLLEKMKELPELNKRFNELFETVKLLKEENDLLKKSMKDSKIMKMLEQEQENEEEIEENEKENDNNKKNEKENDEDAKKLSNEELLVLESILKDIESGEDQKGDYDINKLQILENILKKLENNKDGEEEENKNEEEKNNVEEDNNNDEASDIKNKMLLEAMLKSLGNDKNNEDLDINNTDNKEKEKEQISNNRIYNKKLLKGSPGSINKKSENDDSKNDINKMNKLNSAKKNLNEEDKKSEDNEELEEEAEEESEQNKINKNFNFYKPTKGGMLCFNLSKKEYSLITPDRYEEFLKVFDPETIVQYNTLEGLFIIPSNKSNQLFYYSSLKNTMNELFNFTENHSGGCLFIDNSTKNILAIGGDNSKKVERFSIENGKLEQLPELPEFISKMTCIQIGNKIYSLFGIIKDKKEIESPLLCLDLDNSDKWEEIKFENDAGFKNIYGMSCTNFNDNELLIIGGIIDDKYPNDKLMYYNFEKRKLIKLDNSLPESEDKNYIFTQNNQFNFFLDGDIILYANIDNNNQIHIIDNELHYDLYLTPPQIDNNKF